MKIVISRKGFDSGSGGVPSPILPDGRLLPLPIPSARDPHRYADVTINGVKIGALVEDLTGGRILATDRCHLDPDIDARFVSRRPDGWTPAFGQLGAAQSHLSSHGIGSGDLFLFFGWFRQVERVDGHWRYRKDSPGIHVIYGWLQVQEVLQVDRCDERLKPFARHPHLHGRDHDPNNTLYLARQQLAVPRIVASGAGLFPSLHERRVLTDCGQSKRSVWKLPSWFHQSKGTTLSYHDAPKRWSLTGTECTLQSVARGQEFVLKPGDRKVADKWLEELFSA